MKQIPPIFLRLKQSRSYQNDLAYIQNVKFKGTLKQTSDCDKTEIRCIDPTDMVNENIFFQNMEGGVTPAPIPVKITAA